MQSKARLHDISFGSDGKQRVCFELEWRADLTSLKDKDIRLEASEWREKRSLEANAYFHTLVGKIASALHTSTTEAKNQLLADYGQINYVNGHIDVTIKRDDFEWLRCDTEHLKPTDRTQILSDGNLWRVFIVIRGSHTYDSKEMSVLIDGTISEAKELGIETITENQKAEMIAKWGEKVSSKKQSVASSAEERTA